MANSIHIDTVVLPNRTTERNRKIARRDQKDERTIRWYIIGTAIATTALTIAMYIGFSSVEDTAWLRPAELTDASMALSTVHRAATQAGVLQVRDDSPTALSGWINERIDHQITVPDLSSEGLYPVGARLLLMARSDWPMIQYADRTGQHSDVFVVAAPAGEVRAPAQSVMEPVAGQDTYVDRVHKVGVMYLTLGDTDWMVLSSEDDALHRTVVTTLVAQQG